jgi:hypothetical protein
MKKIYFSFLFTFAISLGSFAQQAQAGFVADQDKPNALTKIAVLKIQSDLGVGSDIGAKAFPILFDYYNAKANVETQAATNTNIVVAEEVAQLVKNRDERLQTILTKSQFETFKKKVEPALKK